MNPIPDASDRDQVAISIEKVLLKIQLDGLGSICKTRTAFGVEVTFDGQRAQGETLDLALIRLAKVMMDNDKYAPYFVDALKQLRLKSV